MRVLNLSCNNCGAPLVVPKSTNYLTCEFCGTTLEVHRDGGAAYTSIRELAERTERLEVDVAQLKANDEIERLDREWEREMETYKVRSKDGEASIPTETGSMLGAGFGAVFGIFWTIFAASIGGGFFAIFGLIVAGAAVMNGMSHANKAREYQQRRQEYEERRRALMERIADN